MKCLITGGSGFIGSNLAERLAKNGAEVVIFDLKPPPKDLPLDRIEFVKGDIKNCEMIINLFRKYDFDAVFHLAAVVGVSRYIEEPIEVIETNVMGLRNILKACLEITSIKRLIFASTSEIYGKNPNIPLKEDSDRVLGPTSVTRWTYSTSKALSEHMLFAAYERYSLPIVIVRPFNVYGPRQDPINLIPRNICRLLKGLPPVMYDDGSQVRCFTFIDDLVEMLIRIIDAKTVIGKAINCGSTEAITIKDLLNLLIKISGQNIKPKSISTKEKFGSSYEDIKIRVPDVSLAQNILGWKAATTLEDGLRITFKWYKENTWFWENFNEKE